MELTFEERRREGRIGHIIRIRDESESDILQEM